MSAAWSQICVFADEPETRDAWWEEIRQEIKSHAKALGCHAVVGYSESTSIWYVRWYWHCFYLYWVCVTPLECLFSLDSVRRCVSCRHRAQLPSSILDTCVKAALTSDWSTTGCLLFQNLLWISPMSQPPNNLNLTAFYDFVLLYWFIFLPGLRNLHQAVVSVTSRTMSSTCRFPLSWPTVTTADGKRYQRQFFLLSSVFHSNLKIYTLFFIWRYLMFCLPQSTCHLKQLSQGRAASSKPGGTTDDDEDTRY